MNSVTLLIGLGPLLGWGLFPTVTNRVKKEIPKHDCSGSLFLYYKVENAY